MHPVERSGVRIERTQRIGQEKLVQIGSQRVVGEEKPLDETKALVGIERALLGQKINAEQPKGQGEEEVRPFFDDRAQHVFIPLEIVDQHQSQGQGDGLDLGKQTEHKAP